MSSIIDTFNNLLALAIENGASDIHIKSSRVACFRINGRLENVEMDPLDAATILEFVNATIPDNHAGTWVTNKQADYSYVLKDSAGGRFRVSAFFQRGSPSIVFRYVKDSPPSFGDLNLREEVLQKMALAKDGIILVCGATGSGKSSTLAAMLDYLNQTVDKHIVTLEDPIEFSYTDNKCIFNQREIGIDAPSFELGLKAVLRQDPDVILVGEMRDKATFETALHAAETGHLVFATLHASNVTQAVQRLFEFFPSDQQRAVQRQVSLSLRGVICQKLVLALLGGRIPVQEILMVDSLARKMIEEGDLEKLPAVIEAGEKTGSQTFNADILRLINEGKIAKQTGLDNSPNPKALEMNLKGIFLSSGGIVT